MPTKNCELHKMTIFTVSQRKYIKTRLYIYKLSQLNNLKSSVFKRTRKKQLFTSSVVIIIDTFRVNRYNRFENIDAARAVEVSVKLHYLLRESSRRNRLNT